MLIQSLKRRRANELSALSITHDRALQITSSSAQHRTTRLDTRENTEFFTLSQYRDINIFWNSSLNKFESETNIDHIPLHGYMTLNAISNVIVQYFEAEEQISWNEFQENCTFKLHHGVAIRPDSVSGLSPFLIYSTNSYIPDRGAFAYVHTMFTVLFKSYLRSYLRSYLNNYFII